VLCCAVLCCAVLCTTHGCAAHEQCAYHGSGNHASVLASGRLFLAFEVSVPLYFAVILANWLIQLDPDAVFAWLVGWLVNQGAFGTQRQVVNEPRGWQHQREGGGEGEDGSSDVCLFAMQPGLITRNTHVAEVSLFTHSSGMWQDARHGTRFQVMDYLITNGREVHPAQKPARSNGHVAGDGARGM
jgi:hypothetical protein